MAIADHPTDVRSAGFAHHGRYPVPLACFDGAVPKSRAYLFAAGSHYRGSCASLRTYRSYTRPRRFLQSGRSPSQSMDALNAYLDEGGRGAALRRLKRPSQSFTLVAEPPNTASSVPTLLAPLRIPSICARFESLAGIMGDTIKYFSNKAMAALIDSNASRNPGPIRGGDGVLFAIHAGDIKRCSV